MYGGPDDTAPQLAQLCHTQTSPQHLATTGNALFVRFRSDDSNNGRGFSATYQAVAGGTCDCASRTQCWTNGI